MNCTILPKRHFKPNCQLIQNLYRWKRISDPSCPLCAKGVVQTNKHVLSNCDSPTALNRYTKRHDSILRELVNWIFTNKMSDWNLFADIEGQNLEPISKVFSNEVRPDIVLAHETRVIILELTVCHEINMQKSKDYKLTKYANIARSLKGPARPVKTNTLEVSTLGFTSDLCQFATDSKLPKLPKSLLTCFANIALRHSYDIYCNRNTAQHYFMNNQAFTPMQYRCFTL